MQTLHTCVGFFSLPCTVLHRIALAVVSEWCHITLREVFWNTDGDLSIL